MRLDTQRESRVVKRKGFAAQTILAVVWFAMSLFIAVYAADWLFDNGHLTYGLIITRLRLPATIQNDTIRLGVIAAVLFVMQLFILVLYSLASPSGRKRPGRPTLDSPDEGPDHRKFDFR